MQPSGGSTGAPGPVAVKSNPLDRQPVLELAVRVAHGSCGRTLAPRAKTARTQ